MDDADRGVPLTGRQRDFLASYPDEVTVYVLDVDSNGAVHIYANGELSEAHREMWVPPEGFLGQPQVELHDAETAIDGLPTLGRETDADTV